MNNKRLRTVGWLFVLFLIVQVSHAGTAIGDGTAEEPAEDVEILQSWHGDFPVSRLQDLPAGQQKLAAGYIDNTNTFTAVWQAMFPSAPAPAPDFTSNLVIFSRNTRFYNRISIVKITLKEGVAEVLAMETMSALPIEDKVAMSMVLVGRKGIKDIRSGSDTVPVQ